MQDEKKTITETEHKDAEGNVTETSTSTTEPDKYWTDVVEEEELKEDDSDQQSDTDTEE